MTIRVESVRGADYADEASRILREAWPPPALNYTPEYIRWQLTFPSPLPVPAVIAWDGREPVGFAAMSARRFRCGPHIWDSGVISFVGVRPQWQQRGIAMALYKELLAAVREMKLPIITFGIEEGVGPKVFLRAYAEASFQALPLGSYPGYACLVRSAAAPSEWEAVTAPQDAIARSLPDLAEDCTIITNDPTDAQICHYLRDPRRRQLILLRNPATQQTGAAWVIETEIITKNGIETVTSLDSVYLPSRDAGALPVLFHAAARWSGRAMPALVTAPSLGGFDASELRKLGIRRTGSGFVGYCCAAEPPAFLHLPQTTNLEII